MKGDLVNWLLGIIEHHRWDLSSFKCLLNHFLCKPTAIIDRSPIYSNLERYKFIFTLMLHGLEILVEVFDTQFSIISEHFSRMSNCHTPTPISTHVDTGTSPSTEKSM